MKRTSLRSTDIAIQYKQPPLQIHHNFTSTLLAERPLSIGALNSRRVDLVGADQERPIRYEHELYDVFDQFIPLH